MFFEICPLCKSKKINNWSHFQTGNELNEIFYFTNYCNDCHKFSFSYHENNEGTFLDNYKITTDKYIVRIDTFQSITEVTKVTSVNVILKLDSIINIKDFTNEEINFKIKTLLLFS